MNERSNFIFIRKLIDSHWLFTQFPISVLLVMDISRQNAV